MSVEQFTSHDVFAMLRPEQVNAVSESAEEVTFEAGDFVFRRGEPATFMFVVLEGQVALRMTGSEGVSLLIDEVPPGVLFGSCVCMELDAYSLDATCTSRSRLLKIRAATLKGMMDADLKLGYALQTSISRIYFKRYLETMRKLQAIVQSLPLETA